MKQSDMFRENAENCAQLAEAAASEPAFQRYKRMEASWRALADEQDGLTEKSLPRVYQRKMRMGAQPRDRSDPKAPGEAAREAACA
jgi:hypothetical protein